MRNVSIAVVLFTASSLVTHAESIGGWFDSLFPRPELKVVTVTDMTSAGTLRPPVSPTRPVYFVAGSAGFREWGGIFAGERTMPPEEVTKTMLKVLAKQGYLPATTEHPPTLLLMWTWGTMNADYFSMDGTYRVQLNERQMLRFLGGEKVGLSTRALTAFEGELMPGLTHLSNAAETIKAAATDHLYIAKVAAYDFEAALRKESVLLWTTRISAPARGFWLPEVLPSMLVIASPFFGRETEKPVWIDATDKFRPEVTLGDPRFVEYVERGQSAVVDVADSGRPVDKSPRKRAERR